MYQQLKVVPKGVLCAVVYDGSPAQMYQLHPMSWITSVNGQEINTLEEFADDQKKANEWLDKELEKNLKNP